MAELHNPWILERLDMLLMAFEDGRVVRYTVQDGKLLYRADLRAPWIQLSPEQTLQHVAIDTVVGRWLKRRTAGGHSMDTDILNRA
jgi:hypothetical protein